MLKKFQMLMSEHNETPAGGEPKVEETPKAEDTKVEEPKVEVPGESDKKDDEPVVELDVLKEGEGEEPLINTEEVKVEEYELSLNEDSKVPDEAFDALVEEAASKGLTKEEAEARLSLLEKAYGDSETVYVKNKVEELKKEFLADERFNTPEKRKEAQVNINRALKYLNMPEMVKEMQSNPLVQNNKAILGLLNAMGKQLQSDTAPKGSPAAPSKPEGNGHTEMLRNMYPAMFEQK